MLEICVNLHFKANFGKSCVQSPFINQFISNSVPEGAAYPGGSSILAGLTNFYILTLRGKKKKEWKGLEMPLLPELAQLSEGGLSVIQQTDRASDIWKAALGAHSLLLVQERGSRGKHYCEDTRPAHVSAGASPLCWLLVAKAAPAHVAWEARDEW